MWGPLVHHSTSSWMQPVLVSSSLQMSLSLIQGQFDHVSLSRKPSSSFLFHAFLRTQLEIIESILWMLMVGLLGLESQYLWGQKLMDKHSSIVLWASSSNMHFINLFRMSYKIKYCHSSLVSNEIMHLLICFPCFPVKLSLPPISWDHFNCLASLCLWLCLWGN